ncbi:MAG: hypothetical protein MJY53_00985 [Bacteroidales bacterium]|nr:hypothetical protein [Bacteroidales bacterium]
MKQDVKDHGLQERQAYVPVKVKVIKITPRKVICQSGDLDRMYRDDKDYGDGFY